MSKAGIMTKIAGVGGKALLKVRKVSPELLLVGGVVCGVAAVVTAITNTRKSIEVTEDIQKDLDGIRDASDAEIAEAEEKGQEELISKLVKKYKKKSFKVWLKAIRQYARVYAPTIILTLLSVAMILGSHGVLKGRYLSTVAAYTALDEAFNDYRSRIADIAGEEAEARFYNGTDEIDITKTDEETGKKKKEKIIKQVREKKDSPYEFDFNRETAPLDWTNNYDHNFMYLKSMQSYCNDKLNAQGHLFLNEALDAIGMPRTQAGSILGWLKGGDGNSDGDGYVDFGFSDYYIDDYCDEAQFQKNIHLNMNCDGIIWDKI